MSFKQKILNIKDCKDNSAIYDVYYNKKLDDKLIYFESRNGFDFAGNIFRIIEELSTGRYGDFKICVYANKSVALKIREFQKNYDLKIDKIITDKKKASKILEKAKYIFTDSGIQEKYVKKEGQIFINTWHGTPIKLMGRHNPGEITSIGHIQHSLLSSDYLIYPNDYMMEKMMGSYMIEKIYPGCVLLEGYPRNSVFFKKSSLKNQFQLEDKEIYIYMPTYRGNVEDKNDVGQKNDIEVFLTKIDSNLDDNQILLVKLHPYNESQIDFSKFNKVKSFPKGYEPYDIINMADCLITDYSSVFFDFANSKRKIIIFNYDEEEYLRFRGLYFPLSDLPYPKVTNIDDLIGELNLNKNYDDSLFIDEFCRYDNPDASKNICEEIFLNKNVSTKKSNFNLKESILIYAGSLQDNDIARIADVLDSIDKSRFNFYITFKQWDEYILENYEDILKKIPEYVEFLPFRFNLTPTFDEKRDYNKYFKSDNLKFPDSLHKLYKRTFDKQFKDLNFKAIINLKPDSYDESFIFTHSNVDNTILICEDNLKTNNKLKDIFKQSNTIIKSSSEEELSKIKLIDEEE